MASAGQPLAFAEGRRRRDGRTVPDAVSGRPPRRARRSRGRPGDDRARRGLSGWSWAAASGPICPSLPQRWRAPAATSRAWALTSATACTTSGYGPWRGLGSGRSAESGRTMPGIPVAEDCSCPACCVRSASFRHSCVALACTPASAPSATEIKVGAVLPLTGAFARVWQLLSAGLSARHGRGQ